MKIKGMYFPCRRLVPLLAALAPWLAHAGAVEDVLAADAAFAARADDAGQGVAFAEFLAPDGVPAEPLQPALARLWGAAGKCRGRAGTARAGRRRRGIRPRIGHPGG